VPYIGIMNIWSLLLLGAGAFMAVGSLALVRGILRAPSGFQDGEGFHAQVEPERVTATAQQVSLSLTPGAGTHFGHAA
jgi:hypothetical protein